MKEDISPEAITSGLPATIIGRRVLYLPLTSSTMDVARQAALKGTAEGTVVLAGEQTAGRGRIKRLWFSPQGCVALSVVLYPEKRSLPYLTMLAALAVVYAIHNVTGLKADIKWPNDVLINKKKVCGILLETDVRDNKVVYATIGIGINVNFCVAEVPDIASIATSLSDELGQPVSRVSLVRQLLVEIEKLYLALPDGAQIHREWCKRLITLGKKVRVTSVTSVLEGIAESVADDGTLLLRLADGSLVPVIAGDVTLREA